MRVEGCGSQVDGALVRVCRLRAVVGVEVVGGAGASVWDRNREHVWGGEDARVRGLNPVHDGVLRSGARGRARRCSWFVLGKFQEQS